ncbi:MAG: AAA family ATPase [Pseudobacter sp.]|uniref:AAA family ATPase n=1 Tax=Pseudobacter sp. TaxID=2045420 RepID=UPI003F7F8C45
MKITKINLKDFHQFKDISIDLTYPKGHPKAGEPLDKVCIIGQSGTGKTTLLKIVGGHTYTLFDLFEEYGPKELEEVNVSMKFGRLEYDIKVKKGSTNEKINTYSATNVLMDGKDVDFEDAVIYRKEQLEKIKTRFIYFPADLKYEFESGNTNLADKKVINFRHEKVGDIWKLVFNEIQKFQEEEIILQQEIAKVAVEKSTDTKAIRKSVKKLEQWRKNAENPIKRLAEECLDPILKHLNLRVKREFKFESKDDLGIVKLEDLNGNEVPYHLLSTGTKQILLTALPLYLLKPDQTLILCDEPERSLYPSMQKFIIDYYTSLTQNSQFFFATHSPIIASSFEPWEIVELKFDEKGFVYQEKYYPEGAERHVDNYTIIPSYLTYDLMLSKVFDMDETHSHDRSEKITEVLMLRNQLLELKKKDQLKTAKAQKLYKNYRDLASKLFWDFELQ